MQKLRTGFFPLECTDKVGCRCDRVLLLDPAHLHAQMLCLNYDCHSKGFQRIIDGILDL
jgi:hypothetical protein